MNSAERVGAEEGGRLSIPMLRMLEWLGEPGTDRYVSWHEVHEYRFGASYESRHSDYPRLPRARVEVACALLRRGLIEEEDRDIHGPTCRISDAGRAAYARWSASSPSSPTGTA